MSLINPARHAAHSAQARIARSFSVQKHASQKQWKCASQANSRTARCQLATACCSIFGPPIPLRIRNDQSLRSTTLKNSPAQRGRAFSSCRTLPQQVTYQVEKEEAADLVADYTDHEGVKDPDLDTDVEPTKDERDDNYKDHFQPNNDKDAEIVKQLHKTLCEDELQHPKLFALYSKLSEPRAAQLPRRVLDRLLTNLSLSRHKNKTAMTRYLSVIDDVKAVKRKIRIKHWNSAIAFAGSSVRKITDTQVNAAVSLWHEMEDKGVQANNVTMNILFDIATKAGKFLLADSIHEEMVSRGLKFSRYFRTSLIYHYGLRGDGEMVRKAYRDFLATNGVVDTSIVNCVIAALVHCGEASSAEQVFDRMKRLHQSKLETAQEPLDWREKRLADAELEESSLQEALVERKTLDGTSWHDFESTNKAFDKLGDTAPQVSIGPDLSTYQLLIHYHAVTSGDIDRVAMLVEEMEDLEIAIHGTIFISLLKGFSIHGGILYSHWTARRLDQTWELLLSAIDADDGAGSVYITEPLVQTAARAFLKCSGPRRAADGWLDLRSRLLHADANTDVDSIEHGLAGIFGEYWNLFNDQLQARR